MTSFEWIALGLILFGMVVPFWLLTVVSAQLAMKQSKEKKTPNRVISYNELMDYLHTAVSKPKGEPQCGASVIATIRELRNFPEQRDLTVLYLEEVNVNGKGKFNELMKAEIAATEAELLKAGQEQ